MTDYTLKEAADALGWNYERLKTDARREKFPTIDLPYGSGRTRKGITQETLDSLRGSQPVDRYESMVALMLYEMRSGVWDGKGRALTDDWVETIEANLERYWSILRVNPSIIGVNAENFKTVMASFTIDREKKQDWHSTKMHVYKAVAALMKVLIREGFKAKPDLEAIRAFRPGKVFELKKDFLDLKDIEEAIDLNRSRVKGREKYDIWVMDILIALYAYGGLRKMEAADLRVDQINLDKGYMHVYGKWSKERVVPILLPLREHLSDFLATPERRAIRSKYLIPQTDGQPLTKTAITTRFQRFKEIYKKQINPHALRRSCATIASIHGMPDGLIQRMLGHKHAATTEGYKMTQDRHMVEWCQTFDFTGHNTPPPAPSPEIPRPAPPRPSGLELLGVY